MSSVSSILPAPGVELLRCHTSASGYRNVYEHGKDGHGNTRYVAKIKIGGVLRSLPDGKSSMPHVSAAAVVRWYRGRYGDDWHRALKQRKKNAQRVWYSASRGGWLACVWLWGMREEVRITTKAGRVLRGAQPTVFMSRRLALSGCHAYATRREGLLFQLALWRA